MERFRDVRTVILDFDGTLHDSIKIYAPAFKKSYEFLVEKGYAVKKEWQEQELYQWIGYSREEMWNEFMPELDEETKKEAGGIVGKEMNLLLKNGKGELYKKSEEVLSYLKKRGYILVFLSNCRLEYKKTVTEVYGLNRFFDYIYSAEEFGWISKAEILGEIRDGLPSEIVMIGDRNKDIEAGVKNKIFTVGCRYGFGTEKELEMSDVIIDSIEELMNIL